MTRFVCSMNDSGSTPVVIGSVCARAFEAIRANPKARNTNMRMKIPRPVAASAREWTAHDKMQPTRWRPPLRDTDRELRWGTLRNESYNEKRDKHPLARARS